MKALLVLIALVSCSSFTHAQKIVTIGDGDNKLDVLDLTANDKITWGGYEEIGVAARSEKDGAINTKAIVVAVGNNSGFDGKPYAAQVCENSTAGGHDDWYLPAKDEAALIYLNIQSFNWDSSYTLWTSTEAAGTQAVSLYTYNGTWYNVQKVDSYNMVCVRKSK